MYTQKTYEYLSSLKNGLGQQKILEYARVNGIPVMRELTAQFLACIVKAKMPKDILEIGTAIGYSGSIMLDNCDGNLTTIEIDGESFERAKANFAANGYENRVTQILGDSVSCIEKLGKKYDLIFLDGAKGQYVKMFETLVSRLNGGGILIADNVLFRGYVSGEEQCPKRMKTIEKRLKEFLHLITEDKRLTTTVLPFDDGVSMSVRAMEDDCD